jgi:hypothetical protein
LVPSHPVSIISLAIPYLVLSVSPFMYLDLQTNHE